MRSLRNSYVNHYPIFYPSVIARGYEHNLSPLLVPVLAIEELVVVIKCV